MREIIRVHHTALRCGITPTAEFEKKGLAQFAINVGTKRGHDCAYCSTGATVRMHPSFKAAGESPFASGYAIVDPGTPAKAAHDALHRKKRGLVQLCTIVDAWAPEAQEHGLGRKCLEAILCQPEWIVRILTKSAAVQNDFDLIQRFRDRVLVGLSITAPPSKSLIMAAVERWASPIEQRMATLAAAARRGLRTYAMLCPLLAGISDGPEQVDELIDFVLDCGVEEVFVEPLNARGPSLVRTEEVPRTAGYRAEAEQVAVIRHAVHWSAYTRRLLETAQSALDRYGCLSKLRFLLYPDRLTPEDESSIRRRHHGVRWLGKSQPP